MEIQSNCFNLIAQKCIFITFSFIFCSSFSYSQLLSLLFFSLSCSLSRSIYFFCSRSLSLSPLAHISLFILLFSLSLCLLLSYKGNHLKKLSSANRMDRNDNRRLFKSAKCLLLALVVGYRQIHNCLSWHFSLFFVRTGCSASVNKFKSGVVNQFPIKWQLSSNQSYFSFVIYHKSQPMLA